MANNLTINIPNLEKNVKDITKTKDTKWWKIGLGIGGGLLALIVVISIFSIIKSIVIILIVIIILLILFVIGFIVYRSIAKEIRKNT